MDMDKIDGQDQFEATIVKWKKDINVHDECQMFCSIWEWPNM